MRARLTIIATTIALLMAGTVPAITQARAAVPPASAATVTGVHGRLNGVAAVSARLAWAVGATRSGRAMILRWNGRNWSVVTNPKLPQGVLNAVAAPSATSAWAVGADATGNSLVMHWNGTTWSRAGGVPAVAGPLNGVAATTTGVWMVGGTGKVASILHRSRSGQWFVVPLPAPANSFLLGVAMSSDGTAWTVGHTVFDQTDRSQSLLLRWSGTMWKPLSTSVLGADADLEADAAGPAHTAWAVGFAGHVLKDAVDAVSLFWDGTSWRKVPVSAPSGISELTAVTAIPGGSAFAAGGTVPSRQAQVSIIVHWTGKAWSRMKSPTRGAGSFLTGVSATSPRNAWAVGEAWGTNEQAVGLILHWNGTAWTVA